jgi:hypothetical protein
VYLYQSFLTMAQCTEILNLQFQKLTRNLFLSLHGQNVHLQQRQLSKFLMRYQQFASHAYCGAAGPVSKMASQQEKAFCVLRFEVSRSVITVQREFRAARFRLWLTHAFRLWFQKWRFFYCLLFYNYELPVSIIVPFFQF